MANLEKIHQWCVALRSGKYTQISNGLLYGSDEQNEACAFGVAGRELLQASWLHQRSSKPIRAELGVDESFYEDVYYLNDSKNKTFEEIADFVEETFLKGTKYERVSSPGA